MASRVVDLQRLSSALEVFWHRPITGEDLQGEIDRLVRDTAWPTVLEELFDALGRDPVLIAESFARPLIAERLARELYAGDARVHGDLAKRVLGELENLGAVDDMPSLSGRYTEMEWVRFGEERSKREVMSEQNASAKLILDPGAWQRLVTDLEHDLGGARLGEVSPLKETAQDYSVTAMLERSEGRLRVATVTWAKRSFDSWWSGNRARFSEAGGAVFRGIRLRSAAPKSVLGNTWSDIPTAGAPGKRAYHTATWTGNEMVVWGGLNTQLVFFGGDRYFPISDTWVPMATDGHPTSRAYHSAVWTGTYIVFWGGWNGSTTYRGDGALYRPAYNTWHDMASGGAPSARREHSATWNGAYMSVFGGWDGTYLGDGGRWAGDYWTTMSAVNAPSARIGHVAVYCEDTSGPIVVWGGENGGGVLGDGREYDAMANSWETMPTALTARTGHSGVYMGSAFAGSSYKGQRRVVFWGGNTGSTTTSTGMGYDPVTNV